MTEDPSSEARVHVVRAWTQQLQREYDQIAFSYRLTLRRPLIVVRSMTGRWGEWDPLTRTLSLSYELIDAHPWVVVLEVLKHEMAHQLVSDTGEDGRPHGIAFAAACQSLGLSGWGASASGNLPPVLPSGHRDPVGLEERRLLDKVNKLLALSGSANEHEAALAMQRVQELYARHNLERAKSGADGDIIFAFISRKRKRMERSEQSILSILSEHFFVDVLHVQQFDAHDLTSYRMAEIYGRPHDVAMAEYVFDFLWRTLDELWRAYRLRTGTRAGLRRSYQLGVLKGFRDKLDRQRSVARAAGSMGLDASECLALIHLTNRRIEERMRQRHPRITTRSGGRSLGDPRSFAAGVEDGHRVTVHKALHEHQKRGHLLTD